MLTVFIPIQSSATELTYNVTYVENHPDKFFLDEGSPPIWYQNYWNGTGLDVPLIENQTGSFDFTVTTNYSSNIWIAIYGYCFDSRDYYTGPWIEHESWLTTNGVVISATGPHIENQTTSLTGYLNVSYFPSGWYKFGLSISTIIYENGDLLLDETPWDVWFFYLNNTLTESETEESTITFNQLPRTPILRKFFFPSIFPPKIQKMT